MNEAVDSMLDPLMVGGEIAHGDRNNTPTGWATSKLTSKLFDQAHEFVKGTIGKTWHSKVCKLSSKVGDKWVKDNKNVAQHDGVYKKSIIKKAF